MAISHTDGRAKGAVFQRFFDASLSAGLFGMKALSGVALSAALVTAPASAAIEGCSELSLTGYRLVSVDPAGPGRSEVTISADIANDDLGTFSDARAVWGFEHPALTIIDETIEFGAVGPNATITATDAWVLELPTDRLAGLRGLIQDENAGVEILCTESPTYAAPTHYFDEATDLVYDSQASLPPVFVFSNTTPLLDAMEPGDYLLLDPEAGGFNPIAFPSAFFPLEIVRVEDVGGTIEVETVPLDPELSILNATFSEKVDQWDGLSGTTLPVEIYQQAVSACEDETHLPDVEEPETCASAQFPFRFNDVDFGQGVTVSGEFQLRGVPLDIQLRIRGGQIKEAAVSSRLEWAASIQVQAASDAVLAEVEQRIFTLPLANFTIPVGPFPVSVTPTIDLQLGTRGEITAGTTFSAYQTGVAGLETGWNDGVYSSQPIVDIDPLVFSPPGLASDQSADFRTFVAANLSLLINGVAGPYLRAEVYGDLKVSPIDDPWFELGSGVDLSGGFALSLFGFDIAEWDAPIEALQIDSLAGNRPPVGPATSGETVRWGVVLDDALGGGAYEPEDVLVLTNGDILVSGDNSTAGGYLVRLDSTGIPIWEKGLGQGTVPIRAFELPSGNTIVGGYRSPAFWLAEHDSLGNRVWEKSWETDPTCTTDDFVPFDDGLGNTNYMLLGHAFGVSDRNPCLARLDAAGELMWVKYYDAPETDWARSILLMPDGDFFLAGHTDADAGDDIVLNAAANGLLMRVDPDGTIVWSKALASREVTLTASAIGSNGDLWFAGSVGGGPLVDLPPLFLGAIDPLGEGARHRTFGQAVDWETEADLGGELNAPPYIPDGGEGYTAFDQIRDLEANEGGFYLAGVTGFFDDSKGLLLNIDEAFGTRWQVQIEGLKGYELYSIADAGDGVVVVGGTKSMLPIGVGGDNSLFVFKHPYEGLIDFDPARLAPSRYNQPVTFPRGTSDGFLPPDEELEDIVFTAVDLVGVAGAPLPSMADKVSTVTVVTEP